MTTRERAHQLLDELPDSEVQALVDLLTSRRTVDDWGDLSKVHEVAFGETMRRLAEEERAAGHEPW